MWWHERCSSIRLFFCQFSSKQVSSSSTNLILIKISLTVTSLDCYVCKDQENNKEKCIKTVKTCNADEDRCLIEVRWEGMKYWQPDLSTQYYVSKRCASQQVCRQQMKAAYDSGRCHRIWYNDWACIDCCHGDRCNFFITLASTSLISDDVLFMMSFILAFISLLYRFWFIILTRQRQACQTWHLLHENLTLIYLKLWLENWECVVSICS